MMPLRYTDRLPKRTRMRQRFTGDVLIPTTNSNLHQEAIRRTLAHRAGDAPDANAIAEAALSTWRQVEVRLTPVIGERGVDVLLGRTLHLTSAVFPWLSFAGNQGDRTATLSYFRTCLAGSQTNIAIEASYALLTNFVNLLATLIGESLTERLLSPVWVPPLPVSEKETPS